MCRILRRKTDSVQYRQSRSINLGLIALATPLRVSPLTRTLDWPFLVATGKSVQIEFRSTPRGAGR